MKSRVVLTLSFFLFFNIIYCQKGSQLLEEIVTVFLANYNVPIPINNHVNFSKKGDQLYVVKKHDFFDQGVEEEFYDFKFKTFSSISLFEKKNPTIEKLQVENFSKEQLTSINIDINNFKKSSTIFRDADIYPFYGYEGFYNDAIKFYEDKSSLTSDQRYSLCRAYTYKVVNMLYDSYPNGMKSERIIVDQNDKIDKKSVDYYLREFSKERESYNRLKAEFPDFMTSTGNVVDKYGFIVMHSYVKLLYFGGEEIASQVLEKNLFTDSLISESREILDSCPKNSVLFTWGDKDTYPLYYLQGFNKYRTDVVLINLSLAVIPRYIKMITSGPYGSSPIKLSFPDKLLNGTKYISHDLNDQDGNIDNIEKYYKFLSENNFTNFGYGSSYIVVPSSSLKISLPDKCSGEYMEINLSKYYFLAEVVQIDFLNSLIWERGIYFTKDCLEYTNSPMKPYLVMKESLLTIDFSLFCK